MYPQLLCRTESGWERQPCLLLFQWWETFSLAHKAEIFFFSPLDSVSGSWKENDIQLNTMLRWTFLTLRVAPPDVFIHSPWCQEDRNYLQPGFSLKHKAWSFENQASRRESGMGGARITELTLETLSLKEQAHRWQIQLPLSFPKAKPAEALHEDNRPWQYLLAEMACIVSPHCIEHVLQIILASLTSEISNQIFPTEMGTQWFFTHTPPENAQISWAIWSWACYSSTPCKICLDWQGQFPHAGLRKRTGTPRQKKKYYSCLNWHLMTTA